jgi:hypothetical protein
LREFVTITVTVGAPADIFGKSLGFADAAGAGSAFCASAGAAIRLQDAASTMAKILLLICLLPALAWADEFMSACRTNQVETPRSR